MWQPVINTRETPAVQAQFTLSVPATAPRVRGITNKSHTQTSTKTTIRTCVTDKARVRHSACQIWSPFSRSKFGEVAGEVACARSCSEDARRRSACVGTVSPVQAERSSAGRKHMYLFLA